MSSRRYAPGALLSPFLITLLVSCVAQKVPQEQAIESHLAIQPACRGEEESPDLYWDLYRSGQKLLDRARHGSLEEAGRLLTELRERLCGNEPLRQSARQSLLEQLAHAEIRIATREGQLAEAEALLERAENEFGEDWSPGSTTCLMLGEAFFEEGELDGALRCFRRARPGGSCGNCWAMAWTEFQLRIGKVHEARLNFPAAIVAYLRAVPNLWAGREEDVFLALGRASLLAFCEIFLIAAMLGGLLRVWKRCRRRKPGHGNSGGVQIDNGVVSSRELNEKTEADSGSSRPEAGSRPRHKPAKTSRAKYLLCLIPVASLMLFSLMFEYVYPGDHPNPELRWFREEGHKNMASIWEVFVAFSLLMLTAMLLCDLIACRLRKRCERRRGSRIAMRRSVELDSLPPVSRDSRSSLPYLENRPLT